VESRPKSCLFACSAAREAACWASRAAKSDAWLFGSRLGGGKRLISLCSLGFYLRPLGGQAGGICGIIRNQSGKRPRDGGPSILMVFLTYATAALRFRPR
jgi:hypothetical protein